MLVDQGITANGMDLFDIDLIDIETGKMVKLSENNRRSSQLNMSPDGKWLTYQIEDHGTQIKLLSTEPGSAPFSLGECTWNDSRDCEMPEWSHDGQKLLWSDGRGVWYYESGGTEPVNLFKNTLEAADAQGVLGEFQVTYEGLTWSPVGRYALTTVHAEPDGSYWTGLLDNRMGRMIQVPDTFGSDSPLGRTAWLEDGRLLVASADTDEGTSAQIKVWRVLPAHEDLLVLDATYDLRSLTGDNMIKTQPAGMIAAIDTITPISSRLVCLVLRTVENIHPASLYCLDLKYHLLRRIVDVPHDVEELEISPDLSGMIITGRHGSTLYASMDGRIYLDISPLLGDSPGKITWLNRPSTGKQSQ